jgi:hypothetical protein
VSLWLHPDDADMYSIIAIEQKVLKFPIRICIFFKFPCDQPSEVYDHHIVGVYGFEIVNWAELEEQGQTALGEPHQWHIFSVVARKA